MRHYLKQTLLATRFTYEWLLLKISKRLASWIAGEEAELCALISKVITSIVVVSFCLLSHQRKLLRAFSTAFYSKCCQCKCNLKLVTVHKQLKASLSTINIQVYIVCEMCEINYWHSSQVSTIDQTYRNETSLCLISMYFK